MPHEINQMVYVGEEPWHHLGRRLPQNASYAEIAEAAGFFEVLARPLYAPGVLEPLPDRRALVRADTGEYLATVGDKYEVVQARDVARTLVEAAAGVKAIFHTAGTLGPTGARFWLLGELPEPMRVKGDSSIIRRYIVGSSAHDASSPVVLQNVATRVVCANTLGVALGEKTKARWAIRHTKSAPERLQEAARGFRELVDGYRRFEQLANVLATTRFSDRKMERVVDRVLPVPEDERDHPRLGNARAKVVQLFEAGAGLHGLRGTAWGAFQAVTEYADHHRSIRSGDQERASKRLESVWFGGSAELKRAGLAAIADEAGVALAA